MIRETLVEKINITSQEVNIIIISDDVSKIDSYSSSSLTACIDIHSPATVSSSRGESSCSKCILVLIASFAFFLGTVTSRSLSR